QERLGGHGLRQVLPHVLRRVERCEVAEKAALRFAQIALAQREHAVREVLSFRPPGAPAAPERRALRLELALCAAPVSPMSSATWPRRPIAVESPHWSFVARNDDSARAARSSAEGRSFNE